MRMSKMSPPPEEIFKEVRESEEYYRKISTDKEFAWQEVLRKEREAKEFQDHSTRDIFIFLAVCTLILLLWLDADFRAGIWNMI